MVKTAVQNIRSKVEKREIVHYLILRERVLHLSQNKAKTEESKKLCKTRASEINSLISMIGNDTLNKRIRVLHQQLHIEKDYKRSVKTGGKS